MNTYFRTGVVTLLLGFSLTACHEAKKSDTSAESTASERKLDFQSDDEFLTYIQKLSIPTSLYAIMMLIMAKYSSTRKHPKALLLY